jgi:hypothetical protein
MAANDIGTVLVRNGSDNLGYDLIERGQQDENFLIQEDGFLILQEDNNGILV